MISACVETVIPGQEGYITSPGYPHPYPSGLDCVWRWTRQEGDHVSLHLVDFDLSASVNCTDDYVNVQNGRLPGMFTRLLFFL